MANYFTLIGRPLGTATDGPAPYEAIFGDYNRSFAVDERDDKRDSGEYAGLRVIKTGDKQADIDAAIDKLNGVTRATPKLRDSDAIAREDKEIGEAVAAARLRVAEAVASDGLLDGASVEARKAGYATDTMLHKVYVSVMMHELKERGLLRSTRC